MCLNEITLELTQRCPNRCIHCSSLSCPETTTQLPLSTVKEVIDDAAELGASTVCLSGGEPFLYPELLEVVDYIHDHGLKTFIYSSGVTYVDGRPSNVPSEILKSLAGKIDKLIINVEAADSKTYDEIMGTSFGGFELMKATIQAAVEMGIVVEAHMVPMKINYKSIPQVIELCKKLGVSLVSFLRLVNQGRTIENTEQIFQTEAEHQIIQNKFLEYNKVYQGYIRLGIPFMSCKNPMNCHTGTVKLDIRYDGNVYPCEAFKTGIPKGKLRSFPDNIISNRLKDIFEQSKYLQEIRALLIDFLNTKNNETCLNQYLRKD